MYYNLNMNCNITAKRKLIQMFVFVNIRILMFEKCFLRLDKLNIHPLILFQTIYRGCLNKLQEVVL